VLPQLVDNFNYKNFSNT